jgi:hypothetical protein
MLALKPFDTPMLNIWETAGLYARVISLMLGKVENE